MHTWDRRAYPNSCESEWGRTHVLYWEGKNWSHYWQYGAEMATIPNFQGTMTITVEFDWTFDEDVPRDWSVIAQGKHCLLYTSDAADE